MVNREEIVEGGREKSGNPKADAVTEQLRKMAESLESNPLPEDGKSAKAAEASPDDEMEKTKAVLERQYGDGKTGEGPLKAEESEEERFVREQGDAILEKEKKDEAGEISFRDVPEFLLDGFKTIKYAFAGKDPNNIKRDELIERVGPEKATAITEYVDGKRLEDFDKRHPDWKPKKKGEKNFSFWRDMVGGIFKKK